MIWLTFSTISPLRLWNKTSVKDTGTGVKIIRKEYGLAARLLSLSIRDTEVSEIVPSEIAVSVSIK